METKELEIQVPEGYEIDKENSSFEKIVFKKKDTKPRSWVEYCELQKSKHAEGYYIDSDSYIQKVNWDTMTNPKVWRSVLPSEELAKAFLAKKKLMSMRQEWIEDWEPDWSDHNTHKWYIRPYNSYMEVDNTYSDIHSLSFPTEKMATDFMNTFRDLLESAKLLI